MKNIGYYGYSKEEYNSCKSIRDSVNEKNVKSITTVAGIAELTLAAVTFITKAEGSNYNSLYLIFGIASTLLAISIRSKRFHLDATIQIYILMFLSYALSVSITVPSANEKAILFPVMLVTLPILFVDVAWRTLLFDVIISIAYCVVAYKVKVPEVARADIYNVIAFGSGSMIVHYFVNKNMVIGYVNRAEKEKLLTAYKKAQEELKRQACTDLMTGLYNRTYFTNEAVHFFEKCNEINDIGYLVMMDLDRFKKINDTLGHQAGDSVIIRVAQVISRHLKGEEYGARLGGDEYIFVLAKRFHKESIEDIIRSILEEVHTIKIMNHNLVSSSMGITKINSSQIVFEDIYRATDKALYQSKENGRNQAVFGQLENSM